MTFQLILVGMQIGLLSAWHDYFDEFQDVKIVSGKFQNVPEFDCMVSPANSFGMMDGGIDAAIIDFFGHKLMKDVQNHIIAEYLGEQPVGSSFIIHTGNAKHPWLAHTPTMRVPMDISRTDNVYLAMWAVLRAVHYHNQNHDTKIKRLLCSGLGTGAGHVPYKEAARQMSLAYKNYLHRPRKLSWRVADKRQSEILYGGDMGFHLPPLE